MSNIPLPSKVEKENSINAILAKGAQPKENCIMNLIRIYKKLGINCILGDVINCLLIAIASTILIYFFSLDLRSTAGLSVSFAISPVFYIILTIVTEAKEKMSNLYELKMTCRYSIRMITALRLLCFSAIGVMVNSIMSLGYSTEYETECFFNILLISLLGMFITSIIVLGTILYANKRNSRYISIGLWFSIFLLPSLLLGEKWNLFLREIPYLVTVVLIVILVTIYLLGIKKLVTEREESVYVGN